MVGLRRGPGGPAEWRVGKLRQAALRGAQEVLEDELAVGLQPISRHCAFLLGRGARPWGDSGDFKSQWSEWWSAEIEDAVGGQIRTLPLVMCQEPVPVPSALETASGFQVVPAAEELVRLEGHQWATHWAEGRGSVFRLDRFGRRGEGVLVPEFCCLEEPKSRLRIQLGTETREVSWIAEGLHKLATSVNRCRKIPVTELIQHIQSCQSLTLMVPVTRLAFKTRASIKEFSRRAARRFPFYIDSIEMGARLQISVVPPLNTASGEPDCLDVEELERTVGAQLFPLSDLKGLLCIRRFGGPPLQIAALGNQLKDICDYLAVTWVDSLFAAPTTWARLFVCVEPCGALEATLGHVPGRGLFTKEIYAPHCACGEAAIGSEVLEETMDTIPVCRDCGAFVPGSEGFFSKKGLAQHTSRPAEELLGSFDTQLDDTLTMADDMISWAEATVPEDCAVLAAGGMLSLKPPKRGWPEDVKAELHQQLQMVIGCPGDALHITMTSTEADSPNLMVTFVMIHPAVLKAGRASELGTADPKMPLLWYQNLEKQLKRMAENQSVRSQWTKSVEDRAVPLLFISDLQRVVLPCSLFLLKHEQLWPTLQAHREGSGRASSIPGEVGLCIDLIRERIGPKDGIERGRRQSLDVQRRRSVQERRATVAEICGAEGMKLQEADLSLLRKLSEDASRRHSLAQDATDKAQRAAAFAASEAAAEAAAEAEAASSSSASSASASPLASEVRDSQGLNAEPEPTEPTEPTEPGPVAPVEATNQAGSPEPSPASPAITVSPNVPEAPQAVSQLPEDPVVTAVLRFKPSLEHLALRLRDLVSQAAWENQAQRVENLLTRWGGPDQALAIAGRSSRSSDFGGQSSLDLSVKACNYHVTHVLLKHLPTASHELVSILNGHNPVTGHSLLYAAVRYSNRHTAFVVQELIRRRADVNGPGSSPSTTSERALVHCVRRADIALIQTLLDHRAFVNLVADDGKTLLQTAVGRGDASILGCLLRNEGCNVNMLDRFQRSALVSALRQDRRPFVLVQMLLDASCSSCSVDVDGMQPLAHAVGLQDPHIYRSLLLGRADPNAVAVPVNDKQTYMLHFAAKARDEVMIACLLQAEADPNLKAKNDRTVLHLAVGLQLSEETVSLILEKRADPNASAGLRAGGETPLRMAVLADNPSVKLLLCARADPNICNQAGCSAFFAASLPGMGAAAQTLLFGDTRVPSTTPPWRSQRASCQSGGMDVTHPMHMASTWRKARWRPRVGRPTLIHTQEVTDFDPLFPFNLPPISKKFRETR